MRLSYVNQLKNIIMELVFTVEDLEPEPRVIRKQIKPEGLLNSNYKSVVKQNLKNASSQSLFGIRQRLKSGQFLFTSNIATALRVSAFMLVFIAIFS